MRPRSGIREWRDGQILPAIARCGGPDCADLLCILARTSGPVSASVARRLPRDSAIRHRRLTPANALLLSPESSRRRPPSWLVLGSTRGSVAPSSKGSRNDSLNLEAAQLLEHRHQAVRAYLR